MHDALTPEERLLKHIRKQDAGKPVPKTKADAAEPGKSAKDRNLFPSMDRALILLSFLLAGYIGYQLLLDRKDINPLLAESKQDVPLQDVKILLPEAKPFSVYASEISQRNIFESPLERDKTQTPVTLSSKAELTKNLRLVGIVLAENSEAIIEDLETKNTVFLHIGESIRGAVLEEIQESKIIFTIEDEKVELAQ
ncbi:MAG: hypothetical protein ABIJ41_07730 [Candidatus Omnitrophota bacterium]